MLKRHRIDHTAWIAPVLLTGAIFVVGFSIPPASARDIEQDEVLQLRRDGKLLPLDTLLDAVRQRYPSARLLEAELESEDGQLIYELEVLTVGGDVRELEMNATSGAILKDEEED